MSREQSTIARRAVLAGLSVLPATAAVAAVPSPVLAHLLALEAESKRVHAAIRQIDQTEVKAHEEEFVRLVFSEGPDAAFALGRTYDRDGIVGRINDLWEVHDKLVEEIISTPATRTAERAVKVRVLAAYHFEKLAASEADAD